MVDGTLFLGVFVCCFCTPYRLILGTCWIGQFCAVACSNFCFLLPTKMVQVSSLPGSMSSSANPSGLSRLGYYHPVIFQESR